jgi:luciferase family oxidoreductase group 1
MPVSILDRSHLTTQIDVRGALSRTVDRAKHAERLGFSRFWVSEHHGVPGVAGASPAVLLAAIGDATRSIRIGSGGVMVPNHQPLVIVEQFGTLDALFPGRIDLGMGRSLGFVRAVRQALRRDAYDHEDFASDIAEIRSLIAHEGDVLASPGAGARLDLFVLASGRSIQIAAHLGLPLVAGGPKVLVPDEAGLTPIDRYRRDYRASATCARPYVVLNLNVLVADTPEAAADLALSEAWAYVNSKMQGAFLPLEAPAAIREKSLDERQQRRLAQMTDGAITGTGGQVRERVMAMIEQTQADELLVSGSFFDHAAALRSDELIATAFGLRG